jgi:hypothetical protein
MKEYLITQAMVQVLINGAFALALLTKWLL